ncbi:hypothetical protein SKAU_G00099090 [Synaphobranchus kaupii]|uniref:Ig-like domain-containing protein n=1 Tax=Synaphobranchus kaupii TaxID=118154 RepID=A0A9Q1FY73_SYNKA|nr:hypothetical protein SKAU_G00099090 [Synaphobranchus kaupii]
MFSGCFLRSLSYFFVGVILRSSGSHSINAECGENITLPCDATRHAKQYRSVTWYKFHSNIRTGIIMKVGDKEKLFRTAKMAKFGEGESLLVPSVRPEDSGVYECRLAAYIGDENKESKLHLNVSECVTPTGTTVTPTGTTVTPIGTTPALDTVTGMMFTSSHPCMDQEVSPVLIISSFSVVAFVKVILSILSVGVLLTIRARDERRRMGMWT